VLRDQEGMRVEKIEVRTLTINGRYPKPS
jgi:hypothetical protein